jgi:hypothetical protein
MANASPFVHHLLFIIHPSINQPLTESALRHREMRLLKPCGVFQSTNGTSMLQQVGQMDTPDTLQI